jgi:hypothetical protein
VFVTLEKMSAPLLPSPLDYVGRRRFAFYPPIAQADPNEWILGPADRSEVQVVNVQTGRTLWILREYIGAVSESSSPLLVVGLTKALKFRAGNIEPKIKQVIEMPSGCAQPELRRSPPSRHLRPAPVIAIRLEPKASSVLNKTFLIACTVAIVIALLSALAASTLRF